MSSCAPEYNAEVALEIVRKYQIIDEENLMRENDESVLFDEDYDQKSKIRHRYEVHTQDEKAELRKAFDYLFGANAVYYKKSIQLV